jgi:hypothetical protein
MVALDESCLSGPSKRLLECLRRLEAVSLGQRKPPALNFFSREDGW